MKHEDATSASSSFLNVEQNPPPVLSDDYNQSGLAKWACKAACLAPTTIFGRIPFHDPKGPWRRYVRVTRTGFTTRYHHPCAPTRSSTPAKNGSRHPCERLLPFVNDRNYRTSISTPCITRSYPQYCQRTQAVARGHHPRSRSPSTRPHSSPPRVRGPRRANRAHQPR